MEPLIPWFEPVIFDIPFLPIPIHGFGILVATGFIVGSSLATRRATRKGLDAGVLERLMTWLVVGTFVGGHVGYGLMYHPQEYLSDPTQFLDPRQGLSSFGGFVTCIALVLWRLRKEKVDAWPYLDSLAYGLTIGWFFGRMGCFVAHDHPGTQTDFWLGVYGICHPQGSNLTVACHDMGLYEALWALGMFFVLGMLDRLPLRAGSLTLTLGLLYGPLRFALDALRPEATDARYLGFTPGQYWSAILTLVCVIFLMRGARADAAETSTS